MTEGSTDEASLKELAGAIKLLDDLEAKEWTADVVVSLVDELSAQMQIDFRRKRRCQPRPLPTATADLSPALRLDSCGRCGEETKRALPTRQRRQLPTTVRNFDRLGKVAAGKRVPPCRALSSLAWRPITGFQPLTLGHSSSSTPLQQCFEGRRVAERSRRYRDAMKQFRKSASNTIRRWHLIREQVLDHDGADQRQNPAAHTNKEA
uniref:Uncharacterized protein n=1 Tax=Sphaerodactylus townsendi TaxID=933632 RepID=A0ACB8EUU5_9SAUR